jgi:hypothetical protein
VKMENFKVQWPAHDPLLSHVLDLNEIYLIDESGVRLSLNELFNSMTLAIQTLEKAVECLLKEKK